MPGAFDDLIPSRAPGAPVSTSGGVVIGRRTADPQKTAATQITQAQAPYAGPKAAADLDATRLANEEKRRKLAQEAGAQTPGDVTKSGDAYLKSLPPELAAQVKALSEGRRAYPTGAALRSPAVQTLIAAASQYDPNLDAGNSITRVKTRADFTSGQAARNITSLNTVLGHIETLYKDSQALHNRGFQPWNAIANTADTITGGSAATKFDNAAHAVVDELERAFRGTNGTQAGIEQWRESLNSSQSPEQHRAVMSQMVELLRSKIDALGDQYAQGMGRSIDGITLLHPHAQAVYNALAPGGSGKIDDSNASPQVGPSGGNPPPPPSGGNGGIETSTKINVDSPQRVVAAQGVTRNQPIDPKIAAGVGALIKQGRPVDEIVNYARANGQNIDPAQVATALDYQKQNPDSTPNVQSSTPVSNSSMEQAAGSAGGAFAAGGLNALTAGFSDELAGAGAALTGGDYTQARDAFNANKHLMSSAHPEADVMGNISGALAGTMLAPALVAKYAPGALGVATNAAARLGPYAPMAGDAAYGALYGAGEDNQNRLAGAGMGAIFGAGGGAVARGATRGLAHIIAPTGGEMRPLYDKGVFPTLGQRLQSKGLAGKAVNTFEQAMQSIPGVGAMVARARQIPRNQFQIGGFNDALGDIGQSLPKGTDPGTVPQAFAKKVFDQSYDTARSGMQFVPDAQHVHDVGQWIKTELDSGVLTKPQADQVAEVIKNNVTSRLANSGGTLDGAGYKAAASDLGRVADAWGSNPATALQADALRNYITLFDGAARRASNPASTALLDATDAGYAKLVRLQKAAELRGGEPGTFTPMQLDRSVQKMGGGVRSGAYNRGEALSQDYATSGRGLVDTLPNSGSAERLMTGQVVGTGAIGGASALGVPVMAIAHSPGALAIAPYAPGLNYLTTRAIAPRDVTLPPMVADWINKIGSEVDNRAPMVGRLAVPAALAWKGGR